MKTNRSPLNKQDQDSHEFDHKPAQSEIEKANFINNKLKKENELVFKSIKRALFRF